MFAKFLILPALGILALGATAQARCGKCDARVVSHVVVVKTCAPARMTHLRKHRKHHLRTRASGHCRASAHFARCPTFYDEFGYACGYPPYVPQPYPYDRSYGVGFRRP